MKRPLTKLFVRTPDGQKTPKMLEVEQRLQRTLEEDFREFYTGKGWGQIRLSKRWGIPRNTIFHSQPRSGSRCWAEMLSLPVERVDDQSGSAVVGTEHRLRCEVCKEPEEHFDSAHWISAAEGGGTESFNILRLCPNCHRKLDRDDPLTIERGKEALLFREAGRILEGGRASEATRRDLASVCEAIITRKIR